MSAGSPKRACSSDGISGHRAEDPVDLTDIVPAPAQFGLQLFHLVG